jgi:cytochrome c peroxidase
MSARHNVIITLSFALALGLAAIGQPSPDSAAISSALPFPIPLGLMSPTFPGGLPPTQEQIAMGKELFFDKSLSIDQTQSCASCHHPENAFADPRSVSLGVAGALGRRNAPSVINAAFLDELSWDGHNSSLETQALEAITSPVEMALPRSAIVARVEPRYGTRLRRAFGTVSAESVARALADYQRSLVAADSPFDRFIFAGDQNAISQSAKAGFRLFLRQGRCIQCHTMRCDDCHPFGGHTAFFTNQRFHNLGIGFNAQAVLAAGADRGREEVTGNAADHGAFKTPSLRNVALTAPYMHDGSLATLEDVVEHYNKGGNPNANLDPEIKPLHLTEQEKRDLVAFLRSLTSAEYRRFLPPEVDKENER